MGTNFTRNSSNQFFTQTGRPMLRTGLDTASPAERERLRERYEAGLRDGTLPRVYALQRLAELDMLEGGAPVTGMGRA